MIETVSLSFYRFDSLRARLWALAQMGFARPAIAQIPGIGFWKLCGSGTGHGFTPLPNTAVYAILATWPSEAVARERLRTTAVFRRYRARAVESWTVFMAATSVRGAWAGVIPFHVSAAPSPGPLAALTRATVRPRIALQFWGRVPAISDVIGDDPNVAFKIGIGEVPLLHQVTFSIWPDTASMAAFARADGPHARAIQAVRDGAWFNEELYARFQILGETGTWEGTSPLTSIQRPAA